MSDKEFNEDLVVNIAMAFKEVFAKQFEIGRAHV